MDSVIEKLAEIEETAEAIVRHAQEQKAEIARELQIQRDEFDNETEARTRQRVEEIRRGNEEKMNTLLQEQRGKNSFAIENLKKDFEEYHAVYAEEILKKIIEV